MSFSYAQDDVTIGTIKEDIISKLSLDSNATVQLYKYDGTLCEDDTEEITYPGAKLILVVIDAPKVQEVKATTVIEPVYNVNVTWDDLTFSYEPTGWDSSTLKYASATWESTWVNGNRVSVENKSNVPVSVAFAFTSAASYEGVIGNFDKPSVNLGTEDTNRNASVMLTLSGLLNDGKADQPKLDNTTIGTITVTIQYGEIPS